MDTNRKVPPPDLGLRAELWNSASEDQLLEQLGLPASPPHLHSRQRGPAAPLRPHIPAGPGHLQVMPPPPPGQPSTGARSSLHTLRRLPSLAPGVPIPLRHPGHSCDNGLSSCLPQPVSCPCPGLASCSSSGNNPPDMLQVRERYPSVASRGTLTKSGTDTEPRTSTARTRPVVPVANGRLPRQPGSPRRAPAAPHPGRLTRRLVGSLPQGLAREQL